MVSAYYRLLHVQADEAIRQRAADEWCVWEDAVSSLPGGRPNPRYDDPAFRMTIAGIVTHYFHHSAWLEPDQLLHHPQPDWLVSPACSSMADSTL